MLHSLTAVTWSWRPGEELAQVSHIRPKARNLMVSRIDYSRRAKSPERPLVYVLESESQGPLVLGSKERGGTKWGRERGVRERR